MALHGVIEQHAERRRVRVVELAGLDGPQEREQESAGDEAAGGDEQDDHAHDGSTLRAAQRIAPAAPPIVPIELIGIRTAATSGVSAPVSAMPMATAL